MFAFKQVPPSFRTPNDLSEDSPLRTNRGTRTRAGIAVMDAASLREKAALCLRISRGLSWNNPARLQLMELAERLERQAKEFELQHHLAEKVA